MIRKIVYIDEEKCDGCGLCIPSCAEGAIQIINGKAKLVKDEYCDGLGACLGNCPMDAIHIIEREADAFNEEAAMEFVASLQASQSKDTKNISTSDNNEPETEKTKSAVLNTGKAQNACSSGGCPGSRTRTLNTQASAPEESGSGDIAFSLKPQLQQWPVQLALVPIQAPYFKNADLLITADCVPFAYPDYHPKLLKGKKVVVGCPKLDNLDAYIAKLTEIVKNNDLKSITVAFMEVPCCNGIVYAAEQAVRAAGSDIPVYKVRITVDGQRQNL